MKNIAIVFFSGYGHTIKVAQAVQAGAEGITNTKVNSIQISAEGDIDEQAWATLEQADAIIFGAPTYMAGAPWQFKKFADASSKPWFGQKWKNKIFAGFTNSASTNGDKHETISYLMHLSQQHGGIWVGLGLLPSNTKAAQKDDVNFLGSSAGLMTVSPSDSSPEEGPSTGNLETAKLFGARVAEITSKFSI
ncbi:flavodoxin family protein [Neisseria sp. Ec49-e6-T10]|uniref:flavodoxin family protein n=1 Tax=Neisseria sp. Ec49-e6-T10 TaxID=3140744 RepID=UPI003EBD92DE